MSRTPDEARHTLDLTCPGLTRAAACRGRARARSCGSTAASPASRSRATRASRRRHAPAHARAVPVDLRVNVPVRPPADTRPAADCSIDRRHRQNHRNIRRSSIGSPVCHTDTPDRNTLEHPVEHSMARAISTGRASPDSCGVPGSARGLLFDPACSGGADPAKDGTAVTGSARACQSIAAGAPAPPPCASP
jgi:hypothetical protein